jgi:D-lactate dehydrogenase
MKVLVYSAQPYEQPELQNASLGKHEMRFTRERLSPDTVPYANGYDAISIFTSDDASAGTLEKLYTQGVRYLALRSTGYDHVDIIKAHLLGMRVANVSDYSPYAVAEHAVALLLAVNRKIVEGQLLMQLQDYRIDRLKGFTIHGKTIGVVGTGKIGMAFARIMLGFGTTLLAYDPLPNPEGIALGIRYVSLEELLRKSDVVSLHCPLNSSTRHLIAEPQMSWIKEGCILVNTSRGAVIHTAAMIDALARGKLGAVCLDVYENEKSIFFHDHRGDIIHDEAFIRLRSFKNVLITGHQAFLTKESVRAIATTTVSNLDDWSANSVCQNEIILPEQTIHANHV